MARKKDSVRVLLVEDSPSDAELLCESLREYPLQTFQIERAERLAEAIEFLTRQTFEVVLLDLTLPDSTGLATCENVRAAARDTPVVVLTGAADEKIALEAMHHGIQDYLVKGQISGGPLGRTISYAVERSRTQRALQEAHEQVQQQAEELRAANEELREHEEALRRLNAELEQRVTAQTLEIRRTYDRLNDVLEMLPAYVVLLTPDHRVPFANRFFRERFGESRGRRCYEYLFERTEVCESCETFKVLQTGTSHHWEWTGPDGRHYDIFDFPFTDTDGASLIMEVGIDITERKRAEDALREANERLEQRVADRTAELAASEARLLLAQEAAHAGTWEWDLRTNKNFWSEPLWRLYGLEPHGCEPSYEAWRQTVHPEDRPRAEQAVQEAAREGAELSVEWRVRDPNGAERWLMSRGQPVRDADGQTMRYRGIVLDITERKRVEVALRESEERYRSLFNGMTEGFALHEIICDEQGVPRDYRFLEVNPAFERLTGLQRSDVVGRLVSQVLPHDDPRWIQVYGEVALTGRSVHFEDYSPELEKHYEVFAYRPAPRQFAVVSLDITRRKQEEAQLHKLNRTLKALGNSSQALMRATEETRYLQEVCKIIVEDCGHAMVWIGYAEDDENKSVRPVAYAGFEEGYLETLKITWADTERGRGPTGTAIRTRRPCICRNMLTDPSFTPWREQAVKRGYASSIVLPLLSDQTAFGAITIYSRQSDPFSEDEVKLLMELAGDLAHGITTLRLRAAHAQAEEAVRQSAQRLRMALEGGQMGRWEWDLQAGSTFWDERTRELLGVSVAVPADTELLLKIVDEHDRGALRGLITRTLADQEDFQAEFRVVRLNQGPLWLASRGKVIRDENGRAVRMIGVMYDLTPRKQLEAELRRLNDQLEEEVQAQTEELKDTIDRLQDEVVRRVLAEGKLRKHAQMLEGFFQHTITPLAFMDGQFNFVRVNEAYAKADNKSPDYFVGKNHFALYPHDENQVIFEQVVRTKQPYRTYAKPFRYPDDPRRVTYWNWQLTPLLGERGEVQFLVLNLEDVTERQNAFHQLERRARQLQKLTLELSQAEDRERKQLAEILHDDLQQQLAAAKFHLGILSTRVKKDGPVHEMAVRLNDMLKDAIEKSRSLSHELSPAVLYQGDLGETFEWLARHVQTKHGLTVHVEARGRIDPQSEPLKAFLYKAAQEILFNVVKHARTQEATLRLQRMHGQLWLTISDKGRGFEPQALSKTAGFGLLSIRERVELLGGRMKIKSVRGRGSTFLIAVPDEQMGETTENEPASVSHRPPEHSTGQRQPGGLPGGRRLRVLLVDDHEVMREGLAALLKEQQDMEIVAQAGNGREAVDLAYRLQPDVVIMDAAMPVMAGDKATRQIKRHLPQTRVVALSMFHENEMADRMRRAGAAVYLLKTAPSDELLAAIRAHN
jgi:PAS domain S-box-containing protein